MKPKAGSPIAGVGVSWLALAAILALLTFPRLSAAEEVRDFVSVTGTASVTTEATTLSCEFVVFVSDESVADGVKRVSRRVKDFRDAFGFEAAPDTANVNSLNGVFKVGSYRFDEHVERDQWGRPVFLADTTVTQELLVRLNNIHKASKWRLMKAIGEVNQAFNDAARVTTTVDCLVPWCYFAPADADALREEAYAKAMQSARNQATNLARLSGRKLGKAIMVRDDTRLDRRVRTQLSEVVSDNTFVTLDVTLTVEFQLED